jgi:hypothetical protein
VPPGEPCNIFAKALGDVKALKAVRAGAVIKVSLGGWGDERAALSHATKNVSLADV